MPNVGSAGLYGKNGGTWKDAADVSGRNGGAWANANEVWAYGASGWQMVWQRNAAPGTTSTPSITYALDGSGGWNATASWTLPTDTDLASVKVRWTFGGTAGSWLTLAATATTSTVAAPSGVTASVEVYTQDTGGLVSATKTGSGAYTPLHRVSSLTFSQSGLDRGTATWSAPSGSTLASYTVAIVSPAQSYTDSAATTTRTFTLAPGNTFTVSVTPVDNTGRAGASRTLALNINAPAPGTPTVSAWSYSTVSLAWTAAVYADTYEVERAIGSGDYSVVASGLTSLSYTASVSQDTTYRFRVRAKGSVYYSSYSGEVRPSIGHASYVSSDPYSASATVNLYANSSGTGSLVGAGGVTVPSNATVTSMSVNLSCTFTTSLFCAWSSRDAYYVVNGAVGAKVAQKNNPWQESFGFAQSGSGLAGILLVGSGWSWTSTGGYRATGTITVSGTQAVTNPAVANGYW